MHSALRRLGGAALLVWVVLTLTFVLVRLAPGDAATLLVPPSAGATDAARLRAELGLGAPIAVQYARWAQRVLHADLGESFTEHRPVTAVLGDALPASVALGGASLTLTFLVGVLVGTLQAARRGSGTDVALTVLSTSLYAAPAYWLSLAVVALFTTGAAAWGFPAVLRLPAFGMRAPGSEASGVAALIDVGRHAVLPLVVLTAIGAAGTARYARASVAEVIEADWVRTAWAKGNGASAVYGRHVLRNALTPLVVLLALTLPGIAAGSVFVESVFAWPGVGRAMVAAIQARDYPVVLGATAVYATLVVLANLLADLALPLLDPRRRDE